MNLILKPLRSFCALLLSCVLVGCAGTNFTLPSDDQLVLESTTKSEAIALLGKPYFQGEQNKNDIEIERLSYVYSGLGGTAAIPGITPARALSLYFVEDVMIGKEFVSSYAEDSTQFDTEKAKAVKRGESVDNVVNALGKPGGEYRYPFVEDKQGYAYVYNFTQTKNVKTKIEIFLVEFDANGIVTKTELNKTGPAD